MAGTGSSGSGTEAAPSQRTLAGGTARANPAVGAMRAALAPHTPAPAPRAPGGGGWAELGFHFKPRWVLWLGADALGQGGGNGDAAEARGRRPEPGTHAPVLEPASPRRGSLREGFKAH